DRTVPLYLGDRSDPRSAEDGLAPSAMPRTCETHVERTENWIADDGRHDGADRTGVPCAHHRGGAGRLPRPGEWQPRDGQRADRRIAPDRPELHQTAVLSPAAVGGG